MTYQEMMENAKLSMGLYCKACPVCDGRACKNQIPGPGAKGVGDTAIRNYKKWQEIRVNMDTICDGGEADTSVNLFGKEFKMPFFAGPVGAVNLHYSDRYDDVSYNNVLVSACADAGIAAFTGDGVNAKVMEAATEAIRENDGCGIPTVKPWNLDTVREKMELVKKSGAFAVAMDIDAAGLPFLKNMNPPAGSKNVQELSEIVKMAGRPFIVKGVMTAKGARKAKEAGADAIIVSNHGGRVLDQCPATAEVLEEIVKEVTALQDMGHKRLAIEAGEDPENNPIEYILESIKTIYSIKHKNGAIRRVNVNIAATTVENYRQLKEAGIGTYILFQETYHKNNYEALHPTGPKSNYAYHTEAMDRAMEGGIDDVGIGVLFGLNTYRYDFIGLLMHVEHLEAKFGVGPHTISVPRICSADDINAGDFPNSISDEIFSKIVAVIRIAVPYTGMIISTRESQESRKKVLELGISQISGGSRTSVGGYAETELPDHNSAQFDVSDTRTLDEVVNWLLELGYIPSFCTACYREGRTGDRFMSLVKSGQIANCCGPNALMTLKEYLEDYASEDTRQKGLELVLKETERIPNPKIREIAIRNLKAIAAGQRDFRF